tara:strand:+ start:194 stop:388 length:195 start_codon:yes stop_codon:yes gene_type:complete
MSFDLKFKAEMFYKTKGHLASKETIEGMFDSYFRRAWGNHEFSVDYRTEGFEEAWKKWKKIHLK